MPEVMKQEISVNELTLGTPFRVYTISPENLWTHKAESEFISLLESVGIWFTLVFFEDNPVLFLKVDCRDNRLSVIGVGHVSEALAELNTLVKKLVTIDSEQRWFVRIYQTKHTFLVVEYNGSYVIYPLATFPSQYTGIETIDELGGYNPVKVLSDIRKQLPGQGDYIRKALESSFTSSTGRLRLPKVIIDDKTSYTVVMQQERGELLFSVTEATPIPAFEERHQSLLNGQTKQEVVQLLGFPMTTRHLEKQDGFGPIPDNLNQGDPYEHWQYSVDGTVYIVWFAATPDHRSDIWTVIGKTTFEEGIIF
ncbi:MAG: hypothetical protein DRR19_19705 [Candidatus Parabeggiatoa sp. nov. 1]|nr:MAG: hypothetical protein DRR19_19705 [Gammaproteobacteria bacterium]